MSRKGKKLGALMVEVMFAIFVAGVCAVVFSSAMPIANRSRAKADQTNLAVGLAQKELEAMKGISPSLDPATLATAGLIDSPTPISPNTYAFTNSDTAVSDSPKKILPSGTGTVTIELIDLELRRVTVEVKWKESGKVRNLKVATLVANLDN